VTRNYALAAAARRVRALAERVPEEYRPDIAVEWGCLIETIEDKPDRVALLAIGNWADQLERRLAQAVLLAPLAVGENPAR
jgi:hypothetical protein